MIAFLHLFKLLESFLQYKRYYFPKYMFHLLAPFPFKKDFCFFVTSSPHSFDEKNRNDYIARRRRGILFSISKGCVPRKKNHLILL